jgi:hypothetical protein
VSPWLAGAYCILALAFGWAIAGGSRWAYRVPFILAAPPLALALWLGRPNAAGWPMSGHVPPHASLVSAFVREPDPARADRGRIYIWLDIGADAPRAFALPYSRPLHQQVARALAHVARHQSVEVRMAHAARGGSRTHGAGVPQLRFVVGRQAGLPPKRAPQASVASIGLTGP